MKKALRFIIPLAAFALLTGCSNGQAQPINFDPSKLDIDTEWEEYNVPIESLSFSDAEKKLELEIGAKHTYSFTCSPKFATPNQLNFTSSNEAIAKVDYENGKYIVSAIDTGHADIVVTGGERDSFNSVNLSVDVKRSIQNFSIAKTSYNIDIIDVNEENQIVVSYEPENTTQTNLTYDVIPVNDGSEPIITIEDGVIKPNGHKGTNLIKVSSKYLPEKEPVTLTVTVSDHYKYLSDFEITADKTEVELGKSATFTVSKLLPSEHSASEDSIQYVSSDESVLSIDDKGEATALKEGTAEVYATILQRGGIKESNKITVTAYEVKMTELSLGEDSKQTRNLINTDPDKLTYQLNYSYKVDRSGATDPTFKEIKYSSDHPEVVSVSEEGLVTLVGPGDAKVTVKDVYSDLETTEDYCDFHVTVNCEGVSISADKITAFCDETVTITAVTNPVKLSDEELDWLVSDVEKLNVKMSDDSRVLKVSAKEEGTYSFMATKDTYKSKEVTVTFSERPGLFDEKDYYVVGSANFKTGISTAGASWDDSKKARIIATPVDPSEDEKDSIEAQYMTTVKFNEGDQWKVRNGASWDNFPTLSKGDDEQYYSHYVFKNSHEMHLVDEQDKGSNIYVDVAANYSIYLKIYKSGWKTVYVEKHQLEVSKTVISLAENDSETIYVTNWASDSISITPSSSLVTCTQDELTPSKVTISSGSTTGEATVTISDGVSEVVVNVTVAHIEKTSIYLNTNGMFDADNAEVFAHAWDEVGGYSYHLTKVSGKNTIYTASINAAYDHILFARCAEGTTELIFENEEAGTAGNYFNKTADMEIPSDKDLWTMKDWNEGVPTGEWSVYDPSRSYNLFTEGTIYLVGNKDFSSGVSATGESWNNVDQAKVVTTKIENNHEYKVTMKFEANDEFRFRNGQSYPNVDVESKGAVEDESITKVGDNLKVKTAGKYDIYFKVDGDGSFSLYIGHTPKLSVDKTTVNVTISGNDTVTASNYTGDLTITGKSEAIATVNEEDGVITVVGVAVGTFEITITDEELDFVKVTINVTATPIDYSKTRLFIQDETGQNWTFSGVDPVAHMWNVEFTSDSPYSTVEELMASSEEFKSSIVKTGTKTIDAQMTWSSEGAGQHYELIVPWYIESFDVCFYATTSSDGDRYFVYEDDPSEHAYQFSAEKGNNYKVYIYNSEGYTARWDGTTFRAHADRYADPYSE